ncbi:hypothetical protein [Clostridium chrysemydis]|uniref:hypothetical protein n=1 Tax=Clostridium chrysemydis TaxID=2665504 RepID=UPI003F3B50CA
MKYSLARIPSSYFYEHKTASVCLKVDDYESTLIDGIVLDPFGVPVPNTGIEVIRVSKDNNEEETVGCIFSNEFGKYAFTLKIIEGYFYKFKLYTKLEE